MNRASCNYQRVDTLSNQELLIMEKQSGLMVCRYYPESQILERLSGCASLGSESPLLLEDVPAQFVKNEIVSPNTAEAYCSFFDKMKQGISEAEVDVRLRIDEKGYCWHHGSYSFVYDDEGAVAYALIMFRDSTDEHERALAVMEWRARVAVAKRDALLLVEASLYKNVVDHVDVHWGDEPLETFDDLVRCGMPMQSGEEVLRAYESFFDRQRLVGLFLEGVREDHFDYQRENDSDWVRVTILMARNTHHDDILVAVSFVGLDDRERKLELLSRKASQDALTGILNREGFERRASEILESNPTKNCVALIIVDLDDFKQINDCLGHQMGDAALRQTANALKGSFYRSDAVGRMGGDEFMVLLAGSFSVESLKKRALSLLETMKMNASTQRQIPISASIGIAYGRKKVDFDELYHAADVALYSAKSAGKGRFHIINLDVEAEDVRVGSRSGLPSLQELNAHPGDRKVMQGRTPYEAIVENIEGGVLAIVLRNEVRLVHCNDWLINLLGYERLEVEKLQEKDCLALLHGEDRACVEDALARMRAGENAVSVTYRMKIKGGGFRRVRLNASMTERRDHEAVFYGVQSDEGQE